MKGKWWGGVALAGMASALLSVVNCGRSQQLVSINIVPSTENFGASNLPVVDSAGAQVQLRALGSYIHPPVTKDITNEVTWTSNTPQMVTVNSTGLITVTGGPCGGTIISATMNTNTSAGGISSSGAVVTGTMTANVICQTSSGGGSSNPALTVTIQGGTGTVSSNPVGLGTCASPGPCVTQAFSSGTSVSLTAAPSSPSTTGTWPACVGGTVTANVCTLYLTGNTTVTAAFN